MNLTQEGNCSSPQMWMEGGNWVGEAMERQTGGGEIRYREIHAEGSRSVKGNLAGR